MAALKARLENRSAHLKYITLAGGQSVAVPPQEQGGIDVTLESDAAVAAFKRALETPTVRDWITAGELVVGTGPKQVAANSESDAGPSSKHRRAGREGE